MLRWTSYIDRKFFLFFIFAFFYSQNSGVKNDLSLRYVDEKLDR